MLIIKQYVVFGVNNVELDEQIEKIAQEFDYAGWDVRKSERGVKSPWAIATTKNVKIHIESCIPNHTSGFRWDNCWISNRVSEEEVKSVIMPMAISNAPEIHLF